MHCVNMYFEDTESLMINHSYLIKTTFELRTIIVHYFLGFQGLKLMRRFCVNLCNFGQFCTKQNMDLICDKYCAKDILLPNII